jgi:hypothetical protein
MTVLLITLVLLATLPFIERCLDRARRSPRQQLRLRVDDTGIECTYPGGATRRAAWPQVTEVRIRTTSEGPVQEDVYWGVHTGTEKPHVVIPNSAIVGSGVHEAFNQRLPGFDNEAVIRAMGCTDDRFFVVWRAASRPAPSP